MDSKNLEIEKKFLMQLNVE